jgi:hypothetical protein
MVVVLTPAVASAAWTAASAGGNGIAKAAALSPVTSASGGNATATSIDLSWTVAGLAPSNYTITRDGSPIACDFSASGLGSAKCRDTFASASSAQTFSYSVQPRLGANWRATATVFTATSAASASSLTIGDITPASQSGKGTISGTVTPAGTAVSYSICGGANNSCTPSAAATTIGTSWSTDYNVASKSGGQFTVFATAGGVTVSKTWTIDH